MNTNGMSILVCEQCGIAHPPLEIGKICPMAKQTVNTGSGELSIDWSQLYDPLKNVLVAQIKMKNWDIEKVNRVFKEIVVNVVQAVEKIQ